MAVLLNGRVHDWVSLKIALAPPFGKLPLLTVQEISYPEHGQEKTLVYGTGANPVGYTRDFYKVTQLEITLLRAEWAEVKLTTGPGYGNLEIPAITVVYIDPVAGLLPVTDTLLSLSVTKEQPMVSAGTDPAKIKVTFSPNSMVLDGIPYTLIPAV